MANELGRRLRKIMTPQETKLWVRLRELKAQGLHFRRQVPREGYIVDFACLKSKLIVEIDGAQHGENIHMQRDGNRDAKLRAAGFAIFRFWNNEVNENLDSVVETIYRAAEARRKSPPLKGEGVTRSVTGGVSFDLGTPPGLLRRPPSPLKRGGIAHRD